MGQPSRHGYRVTRPIGNCADRTTTQSVDVFGAQSGDQGDQGDTWTQKTRVTNYTSNPNYEQLDNRAVPFAGDYFWVTSLGPSPTPPGRTGGTPSRAPIHSR